MRTGMTPEIYLKFIRGMGLNWGSTQGFREGKLGGNSLKVSMMDFWEETMEDLPKCVLVNNFVRQ